MNKLYYGLVALIIGCTYSDSYKKDIVDIPQDKDIVEKIKEKSLDSYFPPLTQFPSGWTQQSLHCGLDLRVLQKKYTLEQECFQVYHGPNDEFLSIMADVWSTEEEFEFQLDKVVNFYLNFYPEFKKILLRNRNTLFMIQSLKDNPKRIDLISQYMLEQASDLTEIKRNF